MEEELIAAKLFLDDLEQINGKSNEIRTLRKALEKQFSQKVLNIKSVRFNGSVRMQFKKGNCPCCNYYVDTDDDATVCKDCGQKLAWS